MPVGTNGKATLLLSGGIDSPVAGYMIAKRGVEIEAVYFHAPPYTSERAKEKVVDLAKLVARYAGPIKLYVVNFTDIQLYIYDQCPHDELTIIISGAQAAFGVTNWYITAAVTLIGGVLAYFVSGRALRPLRSFAAQVENIQPSNLAQCKVSEDVLPEFQRFSRSFNGMIDRLDAGFTAQRQFTGNAAP